MPKLPRSTSSATTSMASGTIPSRPAKPHPDRLKIMHLFPDRPLARGHTIADVAAVTSFVPRWIEQLLARYNAHGPEALGDLRRRNGSAPSVLRPELQQAVAEARAQPPDTPVEVWATDEHRIGLKPILRRVWAPKGQRPIALGHHRYKWLYVTAFIQPTLYGASDVKRFRPRWLST